MAELLASDAQELKAKLAYQFWEQRGRPFWLPGRGLVRGRKGFGIGTTRSGTGFFPVRNHPGSKRGTV